MPQETLLTEPECKALRKLFRRVTDADLLRGVRKLCALAGAEGLMPPEPTVSGALGLLMEETLRMVMPAWRAWMARRRILQISPPDSW